MTLPAATVLLDCCVTVPTARPAPVMALAAATCAWPTTFGTATWAGGLAPPGTTGEPAEPLATAVGAARISLLAATAAPVLLECVGTVRRARREPVVAAVAAGWR